MGILVTDSGFRPEDWKEGFVSPSALPAPDSEEGAAPCPRGVDLASPALEPAQWARLVAHLPQLALIRIRLRHFADCAGYDLARALRRQGYGGRLRARGAVLASHYTLARRAGFSEIELGAHQARLQPCEHWRNHREWHPRWKAIERPAGLRRAAATVTAVTPPGLSPRLVAG